MTIEYNRKQERNEAQLTPIIIPPAYNYIGVFLTFACNLRCSYCINRFNKLKPGRRMLSGDEWVKGLNRIVSHGDLPLSLQGGEPTLHAGFFPIISGIRPDLNIDLLTNLELDITRFKQEVPPGRIRRDAPYASIRVSYHPEEMSIETLAPKVLALLEAGYSIGIWGVLHPDTEAEVLRAQHYCAARGIDFRTKEFLGTYEGRLYGSYRYPDACNGHKGKRVNCRTSELLIGPGGDIFRCHSDLYAGRLPVGHILDPDFAIDAGFKECRSYGLCNPCDVKLKTNRFQIDGHTSVEVTF